MNVNFSIETLHPAIIASVKSVNADEKLVLAAVNDEMAKLSIEVEAKNNDREASGKVSFESKFKAKAAKVDGTPALRLARIHRWLHESANLYLRVETVELPKSIVEWVKAEKFAANPVPAATQA